MDITSTEFVKLYTRFGAHLKTVIKLYQIYNVFYNTYKGFLNFQFSGGGLLLIYGDIRLTIYISGVAYQDLQSANLQEKVARFPDNGCIIECCQIVQNAIVYNFRFKRQLTFDGELQIDDVFASRVVDYTFLIEEPSERPLKKTKLKKYNSNFIGDRFKDVYFTATKKTRSCKKFYKRLVPIDRTHNVRFFNKNLCKFELNNYYNEI